jgi:hypothetical protein
LPSASLSSAAPVAASSTVTMKVLPSRRISDSAGPRRSETTALPKTARLPRYPNAKFSKSIASARRIRRSGILVSFRPSTP